MKQKLGLLVLYYLRFFAKLQLSKKLFEQIIGVTGSSGKSSTRNAIYAVLKNKFSVKASFKANSESGIPLDILDLEMRDYSALDWLRVLFLAPIKVLTNWQKFDFYIVEMGIDSPRPPKNMSFLLSIIKPQKAVYLGANINHGFAFDHLITENEPEKRRQGLIQAISKEKAKLILSLPKNGQAYLNLDDENIQNIMENTRALIRSFGKNKTCDLHFVGLNHQLDVKQSQSNFHFKIKGSKGKETFEIQIKNFLLAEHYAYSFAPAILIGIDAGLTLEEIIESLENDFRLPLSRASTLEGKNSSIIIDSSYNASAMKDLIELVAKSNPKGRKLALLGDMRELGEMTKTAHEEIAKLASEVFDQVYLVGRSMQDFALPILQKRIKDKVQHFSSSKEAGLAITKELHSGDLILVKGSQNTIFLEEAIKEMMLDRENASRLLCRQSQWWHRVKQLNVS